MPSSNAKASASGMGYERKKRSFSNIPITSPTATSSAYRANSSPAAAYHPTRSNPRSPSPPASAYFPFLSEDANTRFVPTPDAESHFAYSTTLRRHPSEGTALASPAVFAAAVNAEASSLWTRVVNTITGRQTNEYQRVENGAPATHKDEAKDTPSGRFAHAHVDVGPNSTNYHCSFN